MKQIKILGVLAIALTLGLASCNKGADQGGGDAAASEQQGGGSEEHVHTFEEGWTSNASKHWHKATCGHNVKGDEAAHVWGAPYEVVDATCEKAGSQKVKCSVCGYEKTETLKALGHSAAPEEGSADWIAVDSPGCTNVGHKKYVCTKCGEDVVVEISALGHVYEQENGEDKVFWTKEANCTEAGQGTKTCTRCGVSENVTKDALGHVYEQENGADKVVWSRQANCTLGGLGVKTCTRCGAEEEVTTEPLGHDLQLVDGAQQAAEGKATVRLYKCSRCDVTYLGFLANEVSLESKKHLSFDEPNSKGEIGARFWGRPIGNALALKEDGSSQNEEADECVYCSTETGDFFEYEFDLTADQAAELETCRLYLDAQPANHMNGGDFFAYREGNSTDWTPGFYIDGADDHVEKDDNGDPVMVYDHARAVGTAAGVELTDQPKVKMGKRITDFRYILYVDDVVQQFDNVTKNPTSGSSTNMQRGVFELPYTFHLKAGTNKISLRMAGGYRSTFYNFTFKPYVEPTQITADQDEIEVREGKTAQITSSAFDGLTYKSANTSIATVDKNGLVTGVKAGTTKITVSKEGNYRDLEIPVTVLEKEGIINLDLSTGVVAPDGGIEVYPGSNGVRLRKFTKDATLTYTFESEMAGFYDIQLRASNANIAETLAVKVNNVDVAVSGTFEGSEYSPQELVIGQANLKLGENVIVFTDIAESTNLIINGIKLFPHVHAWEEAAAADQPVEGATDAAVVKYVCPSCGMVKYEIAAKTAQMVLASGSAWKTDPTTSSDGAFKLNKDGHSASFTFALPKAFSGKMYQRCYMDQYSSNLNKKMFYQTNNHPCIEVTVNTDVVDLSQYADTTFKAVLGEELNGTNSLTKDVELGDVTLATANTIAYTRVETLNMLVTHFVFIGVEA